MRFHFSRAIAACRAEGVVRYCILRFKYQREMYFGPHLVDWLQVAAHRWIDWREVDAIVPVPLHPRKQRHREFNQAEYLADALGKALNVPVVKQRSPGERHIDTNETQCRGAGEEHARRVRCARWGRV